jgi:hypothetical protein
MFRKAHVFPKTGPGPACDARVSSPGLPARAYATRCSQFSATVQPRPTKSPRRGGSRRSAFICENDISQNRINLIFPSLAVENTKMTDARLQMVPRLNPLSHRGSSISPGKSQKTLKFLIRNRHSLLTARQKCPPTSKKGSEIGDQTAPTTSA